MKPIIYLPFAALLMLGACTAAQKAEKAFGEEIFQHWVHSHEDDRADFRAFRPAAYAFPPARGREGFEIKKDGNCTHHQIGPVDVPVLVEGKWSMPDKQILRIAPSDGSAAIDLHILSVDKDMLKVQL